MNASASRCKRGHHARRLCDALANRRGVVLEAATAKTIAAKCATTRKLNRIKTEKSLHGVDRIRAIMDRLRKQEEAIA